MFHLLADLPPKLYGPRAEVMDIAAVELNGDGSIDLLSVETTDPYYIGTRIQVLINDGRGRFRDETATRCRHSRTHRVGQTASSSRTSTTMAGPTSRSRRPSGKSGRAGSPPRSISTAETALHSNSGAAHGAPPDQRGPVGLVNGAGYHALLSVATRQGPPPYFVSRQLVELSAPTSVRATRTSQVASESAAPSTEQSATKCGGRLRRTELGRGWQQQP